MYINFLLLLLLSPSIILVYLIIVLKQRNNSYWCYNKFRQFLSFVLIYSFSWLYEVTEEKFSSMCKSGWPPSLVNTLLRRHQLRFMNIFERELRHSTRFRINWKFLQLFTGRNYWHRTRIKFVKIFFHLNFS